MVGRVLGNYRVLRQLGAGAMGVVYVARDERLGREVALKVINASSYGDTSNKQRFLREARAVAALDHPNIGTLFDIEETSEGQMYMVMARYQGETLEARLQREGRVPVEEVLGIALQVAQGLEHAHRAGVVHRDIKPANLFLNRDGLVKILDFGTAKLIDGSRIHEDSASGTLAYMSPEQLEGASVGAVSDLWAWGVVLFEMLTGLSPFHRVSGSARLFAALHEAPDRLEPHLGAHPLRAQLQQLLDRTLSRDAEQRYTTAGQLVAALVPLIGTGSLGVAGTAPRYDVPNNLSARRKPLWGRDAELAQLARLLPDPAVPLVTLLGQGGVGKSHLARQAAAAQLEQGAFPGGVYFAPLESLGGTSNVPAAIAEAVGLELTRQDAWEEVYSGLADRKLLLVLDNLEHLTALPRYLDRLLEQAPNLSILATSRERLNLAQERVVELHGLESPTDPDDDFSAFAASQLFIQAAQQQAPSFTVDAASRPCVVALCHKLDGWPLGLELAAVWVRQLSCCDIVAEIERNLDILSTRATNVSDRHRSARAVLEYSWERLSENERRIMRQLAVFHGGFDRDAAAAVAGASLLDLAALIDKSLLRAEPSGRYERHPIVYQFCRDKLAEDPGEYEASRDRHAAYYAAYISRFRDDLRGGKQREALLQLEDELENLRLAWLWLAEQGDVTTLYAITNPLYNFYNYRGCYGEGLELFRNAFDRLPDVEGLDVDSLDNSLDSELDDEDDHNANDSADAALVRGVLLSSQGWLHFRNKDYGAARSLAERSLALLETLEETSDTRSRPRTHHRDIASVLTLLGGIADNQQDKADAKRYYQKALERFEALGDDNGMAAVLHNLASVLNDIGDSDAAAQHYQQSLRRYHDLGNQVGVAYNLYSLGVLYLREQRYGEAQASLEQALALCEETGLDALVPNVLQRLGQVAMARGDTRAAARQLRRALQRSDILEDDHSYTSILVSLGQLALQRGELGDAREQIVRTLERLQGRPVSSTLLRCLTNVAELWQHEARTDDAARLLRNILAHPLTPPETTERARALLATLTPDPDDADPGDADPVHDDLADYAHEVLIALATSP